MRPWPWMAFLLIGFAAGPPASAADEPIAADPTIDEPIALRLDDRYAERKLGWTVHVDNDLFALADRDRDYTAGVAFSLGGDAARDRAPRLQAALDRLDSALAVGPFSPSGRTEAHALEAGLLLFTPQDLAAQRPLYDDRPYASLFYVSGTQVTRDEERGVAYQSSLTLGVLGLPLAAQLHRGVHDLTGSTEPRGYDHQISDGGEPTFRYTASRYQRLAQGVLGARPLSLRFGTDASIGYVTELGAEIAARWGRTTLPWWVSPPGSAEYAGHPTISGPRRPGGERLEVLFDAGAKVRLRVYNSFLQGQFRGSDVEYSSDDMNHVLFESWIGVTTVLKNRLSISYTIRRQSEELEIGRGSRGFTWASISFAQQFST
jgi:hypothetical protein